MSKINNGLFTANRGDWETPDDLYNKLDQEFGFQLDVCAWDWNAKAPAWLTPLDDSLSLDWGWVCSHVLRANPVMWMNPPYGREIIKWVGKAFRESRKPILKPRDVGRYSMYQGPKSGTITDQKATVVCLLPARTDTKWWHDYVMKAWEIRLVRGRLKFKGAPTSAPFPSAIVIFTGYQQPVGGPRVIGMDRR